MKYFLLLSCLALMACCGKADKNCGCCNPCDRAGLAPTEKCGCCGDCGKPVCKP